MEGDSALGSVKLSRDAEFQGIMPVRGKILNCLKADYARIFKSEIITDLMKVLGCGVEVQNKHVKDLAAFDLNNLRWSKVVICTDADVDGFQIRTLILTMLYRLTPTLIQEGYVYIAESPLFEINSGDKTWFAYSERGEERDRPGAWRGRRCKIDRSKGLGENEPDMMWLTTMNPETRRLIKVMPEDAEAHRRDVRPAAGGQPPGPEGPHRRERLQVFGDGGYFVRDFGEEPAMRKLDSLLVIGLLIVSCCALLLGGLSLHGSSVRPDDRHVGPIWPELPAGTKGSAALAATEHSGGCPESVVPADGCTVSAKRCPVPSGLAAGYICHL